MISRKTRHRAALAAVVSASAVLPAVAASSSAQAVPIGQGSWSVSVSNASIGCLQIMKPDYVLWEKKGRVINVNPNDHRDTWQLVRVVGTEGIGQWDATYSQRGVDQAQPTTVCRGKNSYIIYNPTHWKNRQYHVGAVCLVGKEGNTGCPTYVTPTTGWH